ncbi:MAG: serine acetyltransferase, partial [Planctomycetota bacterium]
READGSMRRNYKRHPTLEDDVVVYAGATILGGDTVIGRGSVVAGGVFLTRSVPAGHVVTGPKLELRMVSMGGSI